MMFPSPTHPNSLLIISLRNPYQGQAPQYAVGVASNLLDSISGETMPGMSNNNTGTF